LRRASGAVRARRLAGGGRAADYSFTEELARYLMIWMALLAVSCEIAHREHIGVEFVFSRLPGGIPAGWRWRST
jgi:TRAP-type C4-dicarboxylate transport system permease small subunit